MEQLLRPGERLDDLQRNGYRIIQDPERFCFGMDAVLLSGFAALQEGTRVLDLGTGTGILPILLASRTKDCHFTGLELQEESADMARRSVALNGLKDRIDIVTGDIKNASARFGNGSFSAITVNPPYMTQNAGLINRNDAKTIARHEIFCTLKDVLRESSRILPHHGRFFMVHRPFRLAEILSGMQASGLEPKRLRMVYPFADHAPNMILVEGLRGARSGMKVEKPLILFETPGVYSKEIREEYRF